MHGFYFECAQMKINVGDCDDILSRGGGLIKGERKSKKARNVSGCDRFYGFRGVFWYLCGGGVP